MHITAAVYVNDAESGLIQDFDGWLEKLAPHEPTSQYRHNTPAFAGGTSRFPRPPPPDRFAVGPLRGREQVFYAEFDGRRRKRIVLKAIGD